MRRRRHGAVSAAKPFVFIHIPRTGGFSMDQALGICPPHQKARCVDFNGKYSFAVVRNPWDRLVSAYHYIRFTNPRAKGHRAVRAKLFNNYPQRHTFDGFVADMLDAEVRESVRSTQIFMPQHEFVCDAAGDVIVDFVGRFEDLQATLATVCAAIGIAVRDIPRKNGSPHDLYTSYYTPELRDIVADVYAEDIDLFGYEFE